MTSSPDTAATWVPFALSDRTAPLPAPLAPLAQESDPAAGPATGSAPVAWLQPLRSLSQDRSEHEHTRIERAAFQRGLDAGVAEERTRAEEHCRSALAALAGAAEQLESIQSQFARDRERDLHGLAVAIARQMVQREMMLDPLWVGELIQRALALLPLDTQIEVRLHPEDLASLGGSVATLTMPGRPLQISCVADADLDRGGFVLETPHRVVDGRVDVALRQLYEKLDHD